MNNTIARFGTRDGKRTGSVDLILGLTVFEGKYGKQLKPNHVYEIREILGELVIIEVGPCQQPNAWHRTIGDIIEDSPHEILMTADEYSKLTSKRTTPEV